MAPKTRTSYSFTAPWPPSVNHYYRSVSLERGKGVRVYVSKEGKEYRKDAISALFPLPAGLPLRGRLAVSIDLYPPSNRAYDADNRLKPLLDAIEYAGIIENDEQFHEIHVYKTSSKNGKRFKGGKVEVRISTLCPDEPYRVEYYEALELLAIACRDHEVSFVQHMAGVAQRELQKMGVPVKVECSPEDDG